MTNEVVKVEAILQEIQSAKSFEELHKLWVTCEGVRRACRGERNAAMIRKDVELAKKHLYFLNVAAEGKLTIERRVGEELAGLDLKHKGQAWTATEGRGKTIR
jgi:hypothetical protein